MTVEEIRAVVRRLLASRTSLVASVPFFSRLLMHLEIGVEDCETAYTDMKNVVFDPSFAKRLSDTELEFVFLHEVLHCVLNHCIRGRGLNNAVYNIACDIVVNSIALDIMGLEKFTVDKSPVMHLAVNGEPGSKYTAEDIYEMLFNASPQELDAFCRMNGIDPPSASDGPMDRIADASVSAGLTASELAELLCGMGGIDSHGEWKDITDAVMLKDMWKNAVKKAARACGGGSGIPVGIKRHFKDIVYKSEVNWRQVLHDFIRHDRSDYVFTVPDKRYQGEIIMPSFKENIYGDSVKDIWFLIDTSGSVGDDEIAEVYGELASCISQMDNLTGKLSFFDTEVTEPVPFTDEDELLSVRPEGGGGTSFRAIFNYMRENMEPDSLPEAIVILTDGYATFPGEEEAMDVPVIWIISGSDIVAPWGKTVKVGSDQ